jgi:putative membrane protein
MLIIEERTFMKAQCKIDNGMRALLIGVTSVAVLGITLPITADDATPQNTQYKQSDISSEAQRFVKEATASGIEQVRLAEMAEECSDNPSVQQFADMVREDHRQANQKLHEIASAKRIELPERHTPETGSSIHETWNPGQNTMKTPSERMRPPADAEVRDREQRDAQLSRSGNQGSQSYYAGSTASETTTYQDKHNMRPVPNADVRNREGEYAASIQSRQSDRANNQTYRPAQQQQPGNREPRNAQTWADRQSLNDQPQGELSRQSRESQVRGFRDSREKLKSLSGQEFDHVFVSRMLQDHKEAIEIYERAVQNLQDRELKQFAQDTLPKLREHHSKAQELANRIGVSQDSTASR